ncbi:hypothetical protein GEMRC1_002056 [Eukaryota sp. GEM-RC1]
MSSIPFKLRGKAHLMSSVVFVGVILIIFGYALLFRVPLLPHSTLDLSFMKPRDTVQVSGGRESAFKAFMCFEDPPLGRPSPPAIYNHKYSTSISDKSGKFLPVNLNAGSKVHAKAIGMHSSIKKTVVKGRDNFYKWFMKSTGESWCSDNVCDYTAPINSMGSTDLYYFIFENESSSGRSVSINFEFDQTIHDLSDCRKIDCDLSDCDIVLGFQCSSYFAEFWRRNTRVNCRCRWKEV